MLKELLIVFVTSSSTHFSPTFNVWDYHIYIITDFIYVIIHLIMYIFSFACIRIVRSYDEEPCNVEMPNKSLLL